MTENENTLDTENMTDLDGPVNTDGKQPVNDNRQPDAGKKAPEPVSVVGIRFRSCGKVYTFEIGDLEVTPGTKVVVDSKMGLSLGNVVTSKHVIERKGEPLKKVLRIATEQDFETTKDNRSFEDEARLFCVEKVKELKLPMKIVTTETTLDKKRIVFYFTADGRIDFRELVRDLAGKFRTRIEMRQIGVRDEVKLLGGIGCCGRQACCSLFLTSFEPITIRMAKKQDLSINQSKLSGICGRLMCCLGYEYKNGEGAGFEGAKHTEEIGGVTSGLCDEIGENIITEEDIESAPIAPEKSSVGGEPAEDKKDKSDVTGAPARKKRYFKRHKRRSKKHDTEKTGDKPVSEKQTGSSDDKGKGRPFNKRKRFRRKKKQQDAKG